MQIIILYNTHKLINFNYKYILITSNTILYKCLSVYNINLFHIIIIQNKNISIMNIKTIDSLDKQLL